METSGARQVEFFTSFLDICFLTNLLIVSHLELLCTVISLINLNSFKYLSLKVENLVENDEYEKPFCAENNDLCLL